MANFDGGGGRRSREAYHVIQVGEMGPGITCMYLHQCTTKGMHSYRPIVSWFSTWYIGLHAMSTSWENTRKHARALEARLETKLTSYSKLAAQISSGSPRPSSDKLSEQEEGIGGYKLMEEEIEELLEKVRLQSDVEVPA
jgi:hypothetical protein